MRHRKRHQAGDLTAIVSNYYKHKKLTYNKAMKYKNRRNNLYIGEAFYLDAESKEIIASGYSYSRRHARLFAHDGLDSGVENAEDSAL